MRLIDADALYKDITSSIDYCEDVLEIIDRQPTAEMELDEWCEDCKEYDRERHSCPRFNKVIRSTLAEIKPKKGKWINNIHDLPICDQCGYMTPFDRAIDDYEYGNFCPNCGADMRGEE